MPTRQNHLFRRGPTYVWRRRFPLVLAALLGKTHLSRSLRTQNPKIARRRAARLSHVFDLLFDHLSELMAQNLKPLTATDVDRFLIDTFVEILDEGEKDRCLIIPNASLPAWANPDEADDGGGDIDEDGNVTPPPERSPGELAAEQAELHRNNLRVSFIASYTAELEDKLRRRGFMPPNDYMSHMALLRKYVATLATAYEAESRRAEGDFSPLQHPFVPDWQAFGRTDLTKPDLLDRTPLSEAFAAYVKSETDLRPRKIKDWQPKAERTLRLFLEFQPDLPWLQLKRSDAIRFRDWLRSMPAQHGRGLYAGLPSHKAVALRVALDEQVKSNREKFTFEGKPLLLKRQPMSREQAEEQSARMTPKTINNHLWILSGFYTTKFVELDAAPPNPFLNVAYDEDVVEQHSKERAEWTPEKINNLLHSPVWTGAADALYRTYAGDLIIEDGRFWGPLIALFSGMRESEIFQLRPTDIQFDEEADCWVFHVVEHGKFRLKSNKRTRKNDLARKIPVHAELIEMGLLEYRDAAIKAGTYLLFPLYETDTSPDASSFTESFTRWFREYRKGIKDFEKLRDFHSFRANFATNLQRKAKVNPGFVRAMQGHADPEIAAVRYFKGLRPVDTKGTLDLLRYEGVSFEHLHRRNQPARLITLRNSPERQGRTKAVMNATRHNTKA